MPIESAGLAVAGRAARHCLAHRSKSESVPRRVPEFASRREGEEVLKVRRRVLRTRGKVLRTVAPILRECW